ncbi:hypothetical protein E2C01_057741 [Portunus trituberculatus]|uniref:Uncharacterized protein n=1 Tax=Portunus trituberculatus TaxID=210409 RepID=A0A5B7GUD0_PORTR|nr:hypothetical protein [Portunus trituberculatus]
MTSSTSTGKRGSREDDRREETMQKSGKITTKLRDLPIPDTHLHVSLKRLTPSIPVPRHLSLLAVSQHQQETFSQRRILYSEHFHRLRISNVMPLKQYVEQRVNLPMQRLKHPHPTHPLFRRFIFI